MGNYSEGISYVKCTCPQGMHLVYIIGSRRKGKKRRVLCSVREQQMNYIYLENLKNEFEIELKTAHPKIKDFWDDLFTRLDFIEDPELLPEICFVDYTKHIFANEEFYIYNYQIFFTKMINRIKITLFVINFSFSFDGGILSAKFFKTATLPDYCSELEKEVKENAHRITATDETIKSRAWNAILRTVKILNEINK